MGMKRLLGTMLTLALCLMPTGPAKAGPHAYMAQAPLGGQAPAPPDFATRARGAGRVVIAAVEDTQPRFDVNEYGDRLIITRAILRVEETLKGSPSDFIEMDVEGGTIGVATPPKWSGTCIEFTLPLTAEAFERATRHTL